MRVRSYLVSQESWLISRWKVLMEGIFWSGEQLRPRAVEQSLAADGAIAFFSSNILLDGLNADRARS